jgi:glycosyltransferase involved in cell wall biosynthesis
MINGKHVTVVMPAYRAALTVEKTWQALPKQIVDRVILVDDASPDETVVVAKKLGIEVLVHDSNLGYGANQKTCYRTALDRGTDIVVMVHPDYQYEPRLVTAMAAMIESGVYDAVLGSRILGGKSRAGGMPLWKYVANRLLTAIQNIALGAKLSEYHTGYRAFSSKLLGEIDMKNKSNDFIFDNEILLHIILGRYNLGEISVPTKYFDEASSINFRRSVQYGFGVLRVSLQGALWRLGFGSREKFSRPRFAARDRGLDDADS